MRIILLLSFISLSSLINAQVKPVVTSTIKIPNALCVNCKNRLEANLKRMDGVIEFLVNYKKGEAKTKFITDRIDIEQIKTAVSNSGYDADDIAANSDAYLRLPLTCKKKENGGNH